MDIIEDYEMANKGWTQVQAKQENIKIPVLNSTVCALSSERR